MYRKPHVSRCTHSLPFAMYSKRHVSILAGATRRTYEGITTSPAHGASTDIPINGLQGQGRQTRSRIADTGTQYERRQHARRCRSSQQRALLIPALIPAARRRPPSPPPAAAPPPQPAAPTPSPPRSPRCRQAAPTPQADPCGLPGPYAAPLPAANPFLLLLLLLLLRRRRCRQPQRFPHRRLPGRGAPPPLPLRS